MKKKIAKKAARKVVRKSVPKFSRVNVKLPHDIAMQIQAKADRHAGGNLSAWLRRAGLKYVPKENEVIERTELRPRRK